MAPLLSIFVVLLLVSTGFGPVLDHRFAERQPHHTHTYVGPTIPNHREALRSQDPILALMVMYTVTSLWIIAQPIVNESREEAEGISP